VGRKRVADQYRGYYARRPPREAEEERGLLADWEISDPTVGVEIRKTRPVVPVVVVSNDHINELSQLAVVVPLTKNTSHLSPSHAVIPKGTAGLSATSKALTEQIKAVDKRRLVRRLGTLPVHLLAQIDRALRTTLALR
jgi:mRNA interferase MazF